MFIVPVVIALYQSFTVSLPIVSSDPHDSKSMALAPSQQRTLRTRFDIIWTCISTLFICTWVAIHPNIPPRNEGPIRSLWRRIKLMLWTLLVPELILVWAYRQWAGARYYAEMFKEDGWTPTHGHFLIMGGFTLIQADNSEVVVDGDDPHLTKVSKIAFPTITSAEIHDKGRGDFLSKAIVMLQSAWFIAQCVARGVEGIALTELELVTLALASLNGLMYYFWWDKPLGVKEPIKSYPIGTDPPRRIVDILERRLRYRYSSMTSPSIVQKLSLTPFRRLTSFFSQIPGHFHSMGPSCGALYTSIRSSSAVTTCIKELDELRDFPGYKYSWFLYVPTYFIVRTVLVLYESLLRIIDTDYISGSESHVPTFYAPRSPVDDTHLIFIVLAIVAAIFGGLHLIAWGFQFPSHLEQLLWRIGSLTITTFPTISLAVLLLDKFGIRIDLFTLTVLRGPGLVAYMLARVLLITQAVVLLRTQPESAFYAIDWTRFFPHL